MHDFPLSAEDRAGVLEVARTQPLRDRLLAELVLGHGLSLGDALSLRADDIAWGGDHVRLAVRASRGLRQTVTIERALVEGVLEARRNGPLFATASGVPIRADYATRVLLRIAETAGVPKKLSARRLRARRTVGTT
jgi:integrase